MAVICIISEVAPVAQLDRAIASGAIGREFESLRAHQISSFCSITFVPCDRGGIFGISGLCPKLCSTQVGHGGKNSVLRGVDVAAGNCD